MAWQLVAVLVLVLANAFFVAAEFALVSVRRTRIDQLAATGSHSAISVQRALRDMDRQIGAAQVGITIVSLLLGSQGEKVFEPLFLQAASLLGMPQVLLGVTRTSVAFVLAYLVMTAMHVIIGEQLPKTIAIQKAEAAALLIVRPMLLFTKICTPLVWILTVSVNFLLARLGLHNTGGHEQVHTPEELDLLVTHAHEGGMVTDIERDLLHRVINFSDLTAREVMVPRVEMQALPLETTSGALTTYLHGKPHTRVPIYHGSLDDVVGVLHLKDLVRFVASLQESVKQAPAAPVNLMPLVRETLRVPETITIDKLLVQFKKRRQHIAIVIDEYGGTSGLVTMGDLLEQVFGDVHDEFDQTAPEISRRPDGSIQMSGRVLIDEINKLHGVGFSTDEADTMAGLVLNALGRPADVGDEVTIHGARLRVEAVDRLRITSLSLQLPPGEDGQNSET